MELKRKYNFKISQFKEYLRLASQCRELQRGLHKLESNISVMVDADRVDDVFACIKHYHSSLPAVDISQIGDVYPQVRYCYRFNEKPCPVSSCRFNKEKNKYQNQLALLERTQNEKLAAFKRIFERIK